MFYNAIVTYVDLTLKIHSTFINETVRVLQIQLIEHSSNTIKFSISKQILMHFTYADLNLKQLLNMTLLYIYTFNISSFTR